MFLDHTATATPIPPLNLKPSMVKDQCPFKHAGTAAPAGHPVFPAALHGESRLEAR